MSAIFDVPQKPTRARRRRSKKRRAAAVAASLPIPCVYSDAINCVFGLTLCVVIFTHTY